MRVHAVVFRGHDGYWTKDTTICVHINLLPKSLYEKGSRDL